MRSNTLLRAVLLPIVVLGSIFGPRWVSFVLWIALMCYGLFWAFGPVGRREHAEMRAVGVLPQWASLRLFQTVLVVSTAVLVLTIVAR